MNKNTNKLNKAMKKERSDSTWSGLSPEKREKLETWLFDEGLSYCEVLKRAPQELGITCSRSALGRFYQQTLKTKALAQLDESQSAAKAVKGAGVKLDHLRSSALTLIGSRMLEKAMRGGEVTELAALGKLLSDAEKRQIQRERLALARERFQFNAAEAAMAELPRVEGMTEDDLKREKERVQAIIRRMFGKDLPA